VEVLAWDWDLKFVFVAYTVDMKVMTVILEREKLQKDEEQVYSRRKGKCKHPPTPFFVLLIFFSHHLNLTS